MKKIKNAIIILVILILVILGLIIILKLNKENQEKQIELAGDAGEEGEITNEIENVSDMGKFVTVENCVQQYYDALNDNDSQYYEKDGGNYIKASDEEINQARYSVLSKQYIEKNNININNVNNYIKVIDEKVKVVAMQMKQLIDIETEKYIVYGYIMDTGYKYTDDFYMFVNLDLNNKTFSIEPINEKYSNIDDIHFENTIKEIQRNDYNGYNDKVLGYSQKAEEYMTKYKNMILAVPEILYNYLDEDYREKRFQNAEKFKQYVNENKQEIMQVTCKQYLVNDLDNITQYVCKDKYGNIYIFNETAPMQFTLTLDTYTILEDTFKNEYNSGNKQKKVVMNIDRWIQMLNNRDYEAAYNVLDETFREKNWGNVEKFKQYIKEKLPAHYKVTYTNFTENNGIYTQDINLKDILGNEEEISNSIIMKLEDDYNFIMSFEIK